MTSSLRNAVRSALAAPVLLRERRRSGVAWNPLSARMAQDPYPAYAAMRERGPVHRSLLAGAWLFTRHADIDAILRDHRRFSSDPRRGTLTPRQERLLPPPDEFTLLFLDPPDHTRLRALVNKAFARRPVAALEPRIRAVLGDLLDRIDDPAGFDLMAAVARPLPIVVVAGMLGVPPEDRDRFALWSARRARLLEPTIAMRERRLGDAASAAFDAYFREIIAEAAHGAARRHRERAGARRGRRRTAERARDAEPAAPSGHRRHRDRHQPDRQRPAGAAPPSRRAGAAIAERAKLWPFFGFTLVLAAFIYPIVGAWTWGGGWLAQMGFADFAGSTIVHSVGGWAALAGVLVIGPRLGKFRKDGTVKPTPPSNVLLVTLGVFILWLGWFGFNGGSQLALGSALDAVAMSTVLVNTNLAACAGVLAALAVSRPLLGRIDLFAGLNGAIAGLVSITAAPTHNDLYWAVIIGAVGGVLCTLGIKTLEQLKIDDVVGAIPAHLICGIWGTLAATIASPDTNFGVQLVGILAVGAFVFAVSWAVWTLISRTIGLRVSVQAEQMGQDVAELGMESYPEFVLMPENFDD